MKLYEIKKKNIPIVKVNKSLNKYSNVVLFPDKVEEANEMLLKVGLPKRKNTSQVSFIETKSIEAGKRKKATLRYQSKRRPHPLSKRIKGHAK